MWVRGVLLLSVLAACVLAAGSSDGYANPKDNGGKPITVGASADAGDERAPECDHLGQV